jgi:hypothetical protein
MKTSKKLLTVGIAAVACAVVAAPAFADPVRPYAAVGSDTIQDVWNGLTNDSTAVAPSIASYNATSDGNAYQLIQTKTGGAWFARPNGSGDGAKALSDVWDPADTTNTWSAGGVTSTLNHQDVDFSRSSSGPVAGTGLTYAAFARDAVSVAYFTQTGLAAGQNFTTVQLKELYSGVADPSDTSGVVTFDGSGMPSVNGTPVHPLIPQQSSGTRKFFLGAIGVTTLASYISDPATGGIPENNGGPIDTAGDIIPFSAAQWISQNTGKAINTLNSNLAIANINGKTAVSGTGTAMTQGTLFGTKSISGDYSDTPGAGAGVFERDTYVVYPTAFSAAGATSKQTTLVSILTGISAGQIGSTAAKSIIKSYGFGTLSYFGQSSSTTAFKPGAWQH